ncbi:MAG: Wzz/FepE/Etk N-terminal domain-containing protein [Phocaeicola sp.]|nr:Wzz/FepE/Etk N-terminal domain-containing protein [Phocaeicola sp.]MDD7449285.1 Wzz/FepE/Etk N-terminal domain-containing protein [Prevotellaceae bacterium]MDY3913624.1 Wzz/FepE/Etk N-terminal domain-containing protein [Phocaeicola sp.]MDY5939972.1 Wzz/FepE/Etk N-terminal domain-containing protein [Phocaeicola sp.]
MEEKNIAPPTHEEEIDIYEILFTLWKGRKRLIFAAIISAIIGAFVAFTSPVKYTAKCVIFPQVSSKTGGSLSSLASMAGLNLGGADLNGGLPPEVYSKILMSRPFIQDIMNTPISIEAESKKKIPLYEYYSDEKYQSFDIWKVAKKYTIGLPALIIGKEEEVTDEIDMSLTKYLEDSTSVIRVSRKEQEIYDAISSAIQYDYNTKEGLLNLSYIFPEPVAAAQICENLQRTLERYVVNYKVEKVRENLAQVERSFAKARIDFFRLQAEWANFQDSNRGLVTATARAQETRIRGDYDIAYAIYNELATQREQLQVQLKEQKPVLSVIDPVVVPLEKSAPRRGIILAGFLLLGVIVTAVWTIYETFIKNIFRSIKEGKAIVK